MPEAVSHNPSPERSGFDTRPVYVGLKSEQSGTGLGIFLSISIFAYQFHSPMPLHSDSDFTDDIWC
jgi:hypothetical protein